MNVRIVLKKVTIEYAELIIDSSGTAECYATDHYEWAREHWSNGRIVQRTTSHDIAFTDHTQPPIESPGV